MNWTLLANSLLVASASTLFALLVGLAVAMVLAIAPRGVQRLIFLLTIAVLALPSFLVTNCWIDLLGTNGLLQRWLPLNIFSLGGAVWILGLALWPIPALATWSAWQKLEPAFFEVDPMLRGASLVRLLLWPAARAQLALSSAVVFALALNNFAVPTILQVKVFTSEVWVRFNTSLDALGALLLSWPLVLVPLCLLLLLRRNGIPWPRETASAAAPVFRRQLGRAWAATAGAITCVVVLVSLAVPLAQLAINSRTWSELAPAFSAGRHAVINSFVYAITAAFFTAILACGLARVRGLSWLWLLFLMPGVLLGIGAVTFLNRPGLEFFSRTAAIVVTVLILRYLAVARSMAHRGFASLDSDLIDAARLDGARGVTLFRRIVFPQIAPEIAAAAYLVYVLCLWDVETILLVIPPGGETLALRIFNLLHYGHNAHVNALCLLLLLLALAPLILFALIAAVRSRVSRTSFSGKGVNGVTVMLAALVFVATGCGPRVKGDAELISLRSSIFSHVEVIGSRGTGPGEFNKPRSLTCDANDNLFVVDMTGRVQKFSPEGMFLLSWQMPQTDLGKPKGMCRDRSGNVVVLEPHYQRVNHFTPDGKLVTQWGVKGTNAGELTLPRAIAVDTKNNVVVSEYTVVDRVQKFSANGRQCVATWGIPGLANGEFNRAEGICVDTADRIYVADSCNHRIQVFAPDGKFLRTYGKAGEHSGDLSYPYDVQVDEQGRQFVCEFGNSRIQVFDAKDQTIEVIGKAGGAPGEFANPWSIALDSKGNLYVADSQNHRVQKLVRRHGSNSKFQTPNSPELGRLNQALAGSWQSASWPRLALGGLEFTWSLVFGVWSFFPA